MVASVGADEEGNSYNINADDAAGRGGGRARRLQGDVPDRRRRLVPRRGRPGTLVAEASASELRAALAGRQRRHAPEARRLPARGRGRRAERGDRRWPRPALAAARAVHQRGPGHDDRAAELRRRRSRWRLLAELQALERRLRDPDLRAQPGRVRPRRGRAAVGRRGQRVPRLPRRHLGAERRPLPPARGRRDPGAGGEAHPRLEPLLHRAGDAALRRRCRTSSLGGKVFLCNSGAEANEAAIKLARRAPAGRRDRRAARRLPRPHVRGAVGDAAGGQAGAVRAAGARVRRRARRPRRRSSAAVGPQTAAVLLEPIQGESGVLPLSDELLQAARERLRSRAARC